MKLMLINEELKPTNISLQNRIPYGYEENVPEVDKFNYHTVWWFWFVIPVIVGIAIFNFSLNDYG